MGRKLFVSLMAASVLVAFSAGVCLGQGPDGNDRKGKYTYRNVYKACYKRGAIDSKTPPVSPADKTMAQWKRLFEKKDFEEFGCETEWQKLSQEDIMDIYAYLYNHAADSPSPAKCQ